VQSYRHDNERILIQLNERLVQNLNEIKKQMGLESRQRKDFHKEKKHSISVSKSRRSRYSPPSSGGSSDLSGESRSSLDKSSDKRKGRRRH